MHEAGLFQHTHGGTGLDESGRKDCPHMRRGARFAEKLANGGGGEAATLPSRCEVWIGDDRVARQPKRFGKYVPGFGYIAAARPPERRRIVDRGVEQLQIVGHEVDERSRHYRRSIASRPTKRKCSPFGTISAAASPRAPRARRTGGASARSVSAAAACDGEEAVRQNHNGEVAAAVHSAVASEPNTARRDLAAPQTKEY